MKKVLRFTPLFMLVVLLGVYLSGCVNFEQKTTLAKDGSGSMKIHYWTKHVKNITSDELQGFPFSESKVKDTYGTGGNEISNIKIEEKDEADTTKHVTFDLKFKDINKISEAKGFSKIKASWTEGKEGMEFKYVLAKDTSSSGSMGASDYKLTYEFEFPGEVLSTNGSKEGQKVSWNKTVADLKEDIEMKATVKSDKKKCGLFGLELPIVILAGFSFWSLRRKK